MKVKLLSIALLGIMTVGCGPSDADQKAHEAERETAVQELEENWEDDLGDMMEEVEEAVEVATDEMEAQIDSTEIEASEEH